MNNEQTFNEENFTSGISVYSNGRNEWSQRFINSYGLFLLLSGSCEISINEDTFCPKPKDMILMYPGFKHTFKRGPNTELIWFHFTPRPHIMPLLDWGKEISGLADVHFEEDEFEVVKRELLEAHQLEKKHFCGWYMLASLLLETVISRGYNHLLSQKLEITQSIQTARELLMKQQENIDSIAKKCGLSRAALYNKFKQATGLSPRQYRESLIMRHAIHLLESSSMSITEIAEQLGISDPFYFSNRFRKYYGTSPRQYRNNLMN